MTIKLMTIVGTRPEIIKLCRVIYELDQHADHTLVHSGQNYDYELNGVFFEQLGIRKPDYFLNAVGDTVAQTIGNIIARSDEVMVKIKPHALLLLGDTNSCLSAISAKRRKIPIYFTWRRATAVLISECLKKSTVKLWIIPAISI